MNRYMIDGGEGIVAAKLLITSSGVAIFKDFDGDNMLILKDYQTIELVDKDVPDEDDDEDEDEEEETAGGFPLLQKD
jgi:hypothetical protein